MTASLPSLTTPAMPPLPPAAAERLRAFSAHIESMAPSLVGYPVSQDYDYPEVMPFLKYALNNIGDPFSDSYFRENTYEFEREVIAFFQKHLRAPDAGTWGYMTAGGTEGNLYGLYLARETFPKGVIYFSEHTHYSAAKIVKVLGARSIMIRGQENGEIDYEDLRAMLQVHRDVPPIIFANIGNTMHGAVDNLTKIRAMLKELVIPEYYLHADAALSGMILPWVNQPQPFGFDSGIDSIAVSGHKFIGSPMPCGIVLALRKHVDRVARGVEYVGCMDTTIAGSRNAITPLIMWCAIQRWGEDGFRRRAAACLAMADYCIERLKARGIAAWRHPNSFTVVFPNPGPDVISRWQMAPCGGVAHLITMPHITAAIVDRVTGEIAEALKSKTTAPDRP